MNASHLHKPRPSSHGQEVDFWTMAHQPRPGRWPALARVVEAFFSRYRRFLPVVHAVMFVFFLALLFLPLALPVPPEHATPLNNLTVLFNWLLWGLWFPLVFMSVVFTGRSWCGVLCPMGAASEWANKVGLQRPIPRWVRWEGTPIVSFLVITILGQTLGVRDHPEAIAEVFGATLFAAVMLGFIYGRNKRAWCRHACPIGLLLGVFSRIGATQFAAKAKKPGGDLYTERGVCPTMIAIPRKEESRHCIECFRCVKPSSPGGLYLRLRTPGEEVAEIRKHNPNLSEIWFMFLGTGAALGGFLWLVLPGYQDLRMSLGMWAIDQGWDWIGNAGPWWLMSHHPDQREVFNWLDFIMIVGYMLGWTALMGAVLGTATAASAWLAGLFRGDRNFRARFVELGYLFAPVAMVSLLLGLGGKLFETIGELGLAPSLLADIKIALIVGAIVWSLWLGRKILAVQGVGGMGALCTLVPGLLGTLFVAAAWWPAVVGL